MKEKNFATIDETNGSGKPAVINVRVDADTKKRLRMAAASLSLQEQTHISLTTVVGLALEYGLELLERDAAGFALVKTSKLTGTQRSLALAEEACKIGFAHLVRLAQGADGEHVSDSTKSP